MDMSKTQQDLGIKRIPKSVKRFLDKMRDKQRWRIPKSVKRFLGKMRDGEEFTHQTKSGAFREMRETRQQNSYGALPERFANRFNIQEDRFMQKSTFGRLNPLSLRFTRLGGAALLGLLVAGCSTSGSQQGAVSTTGEQRVTQADLQAYCPRISLREGTSFFSTYEKGGNGDSSRVVYQASISDVTRDCRRDNGTLTITVAAAGRVVPGPKFRNGTINMPIRVVVMEGDKVISTKLHKQAVAMNNSQSATQFLFAGTPVSVPEASSRQVQIFIGFDEGPNKG